MPKYKVNTIFENPKELGGLEIKVIAVSDEKDYEYNDFKYFVKISYKGDIGYSCYAEKELTNYVQNMNLKEGGTING